MNRFQIIADVLESKGIDGVLITDMKNIRYLSGFTGSSGMLLITRKARIFCTDFRYGEQARKEVRGLEILIEQNESHRMIIEKSKSIGIKTLGFESSASYMLYKRLLRKGVRIKAVSSLVEDVRKIKNRVELSFIQKAVRRAEKAFMEVKPHIQRGVTEKRIANMLEENLKKKGCSVLPFDIIVASGRNSSMPHARPTEKKIKAGDLVVVDWGGEAGGYFSDMTRSFLMHGRGISRKREIYESVLQSNRKAIHAVKEGQHSGMVDRAARDVITKAGFGDFFGHGTGHGVGLDVHELPRISRRGGEFLQAGMVFTVEPGIYLPGVGGVRIEDMVFAEKHGCTVLTSLPKGLEIIH